MPPKRPEKKASAKGRSATEASSSEDAPTPAKGTPQSRRQSADGKRPVKATAAKAVPKEPKGTAAETASAAFLTRALRAVVVVAAVVGLLLALSEAPVGGGSAGVSKGGRVRRSPCSCARPAFMKSAPGSVQRQLASSLLVPRASALSAVHVRVSGGGGSGGSVSSVKTALGFVETCGVVRHIRSPLATVDELHQALVGPFTGATCVVWLVEESTIAKVAGALKELLEDNTLRGSPVVPAGSQAMLVLTSDKTREELKATLPHRVVHMFATV